MPDRHILLARLKRLLPAQFNEVVFRLELDESFLSQNVALADKAQQVIKYLLQFPDGLTRLENVLNDISNSSGSSSTPFSSNSKHSYLKTFIEAIKIPLSAVILLLIGVIIIGFIKTWNTHNNNKPMPIPKPLPSLKKFDINYLAQEQKKEFSSISNLKATQIFKGRVNLSEQEKSYLFSLDKLSNISIYLDQVNTDILLNLYEDTNETGLISSHLVKADRASISNPGLIREVLGVGQYRIVVKLPELSKRSSDYILQLVNHTHEAVNVGTLKGTRTFSDSLTPNNQVKYYKFSLNSPSKVNFYLDDVTSEANIKLFADKNEDGVINKNENGGLDGANASSSSSGKFSQVLGAGNYFVVISRKNNNTSYTLTLISP